jgi:hypothetical protein
MRSARVLHTLVLLVFTGCAQASPLEPGMEAVEKIRGLEFKQDVKNVVIDRADLARHLEDQMERTTPYPLDQWASMLRALQLVEGDTKTMLPSLLALYESQVLAFYDPQSHTYYSIRQMPKLPDAAAKLVDPKVLEETVMVHELMHALQDQHFSLSSREKALVRDTDANLAYHAVLEGEAVLVMMAHMLEKNGVSLDEVVKDDSMLAMLGTAVQADSMIDPSTPRYFAEMLKFPYLEGLKFVAAAYRRGGWKAVDAIHANPPHSSREILDPDAYFARKPSAPARRFDPKAPAGAIAAEHLGVFHWRFLVGAKPSEGWVDDRVVVYPDGRVDVSTTWESDAHATAFADAYISFLKGRGLAPKVTREGSIVKVQYKA